MEDVPPSPLQLSVDLYSLLDVENFLYTDIPSSNLGIDTPALANRDPYPVSYSIDLFQASIQTGDLVTESSPLPVQHEVSMYPPSEISGDPPEGSQPSNVSPSLGHPVLEATHQSTIDDPEHQEHAMDVRPDFEESSLNREESSVSFRVDGVVCNVPASGFFSSNPDLFRKLGVTNIQESIIDVPDITFSSFECLLALMYPGTQLSQTYEEWIGALHLSTLWDLPDIRARAIAGISQIDGFPSDRPVDLVLLAKKYRVGSWLRTAYTQLVEYPVLTSDDLERTTGGFSLTPEAKKWLLLANSTFKKFENKSPKREDCEWCLFAQESLDSWGAGYNPAYECVMHPSVESFVLKLIEAQSEEMVSNTAPPPAGYRLALKTGPAFVILDSRVPHEEWDEAESGNDVYFASALRDHSVVPCIAGILPKLYARVAIDGREVQHEGRFDLLFYVPEKMELVHTSYGRIPEGRQPVQGGYEEDGNELYHAVAAVGGARVLGRTGKHLAAAKVLLNGVEHTIEEDYKILCWR